MPLFTYIGWIIGVFEEMSHLSSYSQKNVAYLEEVESEDKSKEEKKQNGEFDWTTLVATLGSMGLALLTLMVAYKTCDCCKEVCMIRI